MHARSRLASAATSALLGLAASAPLAGCAAARCRPCPCPCPCPDPAGPARVGDPWVAAAAANPWRVAAVAHGRGQAAVWSYLAATYDRDADGKVTPQEAGHAGASVPAFARLDRDGDGVLTRADFEGPTRMAGYIAAMTLARIGASLPPGEDGERVRSSEALPSATVVARVLAAADRDGDGVLTAAEVDAALEAAQAKAVPGVLDLPAGVPPHPYLLEVADADRSGTLAVAEVVAWRDAAAAPRAAMQREAQAAARAAAEAASAAAPDAVRPPPRAPRPPAPAVGAPAPDFTLRSRGGTKTRSLADLRGKPVVLVFGSYTCPPFRASAPWIRAAYDRHRDQVPFLFVYVREAHAIDGRAPMPSADQPVVEEARTFEDRRRVADACALDLRFGVFETLVDDLDDSVERAYAAAPARLYVVDREGKIAYRSGPGPFGLRQAEFEAALERAVSGEALGKAEVAAPPGDAARP